VFFNDDLMSRKWQAGTVDCAHLDTATMTGARRSRRFGVEFAVNREYHGNNRLSQAEAA